MRENNSAFQSYCVIILLNILRDRILLLVVMVICRSTFKGDKNIHKSFEILNIGLEIY